MLPVKNNLGNDTSGLAYVLEKQPEQLQPSLRWEEGPVALTADQAMALTPPELVSPMEKAQSFLREILSEGPVPSREIFAKGKENDISERTLERAKKELGILAEKKDFIGEWFWRFKDYEPALLSD